MNKLANASPWTGPGPFEFIYANYYMVPCPACSAGVCNYCAPDRETDTDVGPVVHEARREAWRAVYGSDAPKQAAEGEV